MSIGRGQRSPVGRPCVSIKSIMPKVRWRAESEIKDLRSEEDKIGAKADQREEG